jgi:hypothetical protein
VRTFENFRAAVSLNVAHYLTSKTMKTIIARVDATNTNITQEWDVIHSSSKYYLVVTRFQDGQVFAIQLDGLRIQLLNKDDLAERLDQLESSKEKNMEQVEAAVEQIREIPRFGYLGNLALSDAQVMTLEPD